MTTVHTGEELFEGDYQVSRSRDVIRDTSFLLR